MTEIYAHRGSKGTHPENTLIAFRECLNLAITGIELDVHLSKDGKLIVMHDDFIDRTTNGKGEIRNYTLAELKKFNVGNYRDEPQKIPTLEEVLDLCQSSGLTLNIELKTDVNRYRGIERKVLRLLKKKQGDLTVIFCSFNFKTLRRLRRLNRKANLNVLIKRNLKPGLKWAKKVKADAMHPPFYMKNKAEAWETLYKTRYWTINKVEDMRECFANPNVTGFMTDFPALAAEIKEEMERAETDV